VSPPPGCWSAAVALSVSSPVEPSPEGTMLRGGALGRWDDKVGMGKDCRKVVLSKCSRASEELNPACRQRRISEFDVLHVVCWYVFAISQVYC